jgi:hypothetical protein
LNTVTISLYANATNMGVDHVGAVAPGQTQQPSIRPLHPSEDANYGDLGQAFPSWPAPASSAMLQPPKPEIKPSEQIMKHALDHDPDMEAAD